MRMSLGLHLVTASPGRNAGTFCETKYSRTGPGGRCRVRARASDCWIGLWHFARFPLAARGDFRGGRPLGAKFFRAADDAFDEIGRSLFFCGSIGSAAVGRDFKEL